MQSHSPTMNKTFLKDWFSKTCFSLEQQHGAGIKSISVVGDVGVLSKMSNSMNVLCCWDFVCGRQRWGLKFLFLFLHNYTWMRWKCLFISLHPIWPIYSTLRNLVKTKTAYFLHSWELVDWNNCTFIFTINYTMTPCDDRSFVYTDIDIDLKRMRGW